MRTTSAFLGQATVTLGHVRPTLIAVVLETVGAAWFLAFMLAESWIVLLALLALAAAALIVVQRYRALDRFLEDCFHRAQAPAFVWAAVLVVAFPFLLRGNSYVLHLLILAQIYAVLALALNFQLGSANIPNFATAASYGIGAYVSALLAIHFGVSFWLGLIAAAVVATAFGFLLGLPCMRTRDYYLALVTISFGVVIHQLLNNFEWTGGPNGLVGIPAPTLFGHSFRRPIDILGFRLPSQANFYYLTFALLLLTIAVANRLHNSRVGLAWNALRNDELAARLQGINVTWYKVLAFAVDAFLAAFAGTIYAFYVSYISPDNFTFLVSVTIMTMVILGGMDNIFGVIVGATLLTILPEKFRIFADYRLLIFGTIVIAMLMIRPEGLFPRRLRRYQFGP
jgi:ABC-type branched-subunit amino acid transport system permease subunit